MREYKYGYEQIATVILPDLLSRISKLEQLTNANDYEYITETKLVKKGKKK